MYSFSLMDWEVAEQGEDGLYTRLVYFVVAVDSTGRRFAHFHTFKTSDDAFKLLARIEASGKCDPANSEHWNEIFPVYGSAAYESNPHSDRAEALRAAGDIKGAELEEEISR